MTPREKADRAKQLLEDELLKEAFSAVRAGLIDRLESAAVGDVEFQHEIALMLQLLKRIRTQLEQYLQDRRVIEAEQRQQDWMTRARQKVGI